MPGNKFGHKGKQYLAVPEIGHQCGICVFIAVIDGCHSLQRHLKVHDCKDHNYIVIEDTPEGIAHYTRHKLGVDTEDG